MDFVVVGLGLGALALLGGVCLCAWAGGAERSAARAATPQDAAHDVAQAAWRRGAGQALLGAGSAVLLATIGALAGSLKDQTGAFLVTTTATVAALGLLLWAYLFRSRHPIPPRSSQISTAVPAPVGTASSPRGHAIAAPAPVDTAVAAQQAEPVAAAEPEPDAEPLKPRPEETVAEVASTSAPERGPREPEQDSHPPEQDLHEPDLAANDGSAENAAEDAAPVAPTPPPGIADLVAYSARARPPRQLPDDESEGTS